MLTTIKIFDYLLIFVEIKRVSTESMMEANRIKTTIFVKEQIN